MNKIKIATIALAAAIVVAGHSPAMAGDGPALGAKLIDGIIVRPIGVAVSLATSVLYIGTSPLTFLMDVDEPAADVLVSAPWKATSGRPLGDFGGRGD